MENPEIFSQEISYLQGARRHHIKQHIATRTQNSGHGEEIIGRIKSPFRLLVAVTVFQGCK